MRHAPVRRCRHFRSCLPDRVLCLARLRGERARRHRCALCRVCRACRGTRTHHLAGRDAAPRPAADRRHAPRAAKQCRPGRLRALRHAAAPAHPARRDLPGCAVAAPVVPDAAAPLQLLPPPASHQSQPLHVLRGLWRRTARRRESRDAVPDRPGQGRRACDCRDRAPRRDAAGRCRPRRGAPAVAQGPRRAYHAR